MIKMASVPKYSIEEKKYKDDRVFQKINKKYLTLNEGQRKLNNEHLKSVVEQKFIPLMKEDGLFNLLFQRIMYGGSFYKGTKYGLPNEFDLDFVLKLPINYKRIIIHANHDNYGFIKIELDTTGPMHPKWMNYSKTLDSWLTEDNYLNQDKFNRWMQKIFENIFRKLSRNGNLDSSYSIASENGRTYEARYAKNGPAFTVKIRTEEGSHIDIDIVPCLEFDNVELCYGYKSLNGSRKSWMAVSKPLSECIQNRTTLWRLCFYESEKELLQGEIKPVIRMMKKFRDSHNWKSIASYYIETIIYHDLEAHQYDLGSYLKTSKTLLFVNALKKLKETFRMRRLEYFWHPSYNLFEKINSYELNIYFNTLQKYINYIDKNIEHDGNVLAKIVLTPAEYEDFIMSPLTSDMSYLHVNANREGSVAIENADYRCIIL